MDIILDACPIINLFNGEVFHKIIEIPSVKMYVGELLLEQEILNSIQKLKIKTLIASQHLYLLESVISISQFTEMKNRYSLGDGETECIALCKNLKYTIATDDLKARSAAAIELGNEFVRGSLFLLRETVNAGIISCNEAKSAYHLMITRGGFLPKNKEKYLCEAKVSS